MIESGAMRGGKRLAGQYFLVKIQPMRVRMGNSKLPMMVMEIYQAMLGGKQPAGYLFLVLTLHLIVQLVLGLGVYQLHQVNFQAMLGPKILATFNLIVMSV